MGTLSMYRAVMGDAFDRLAPSIQKFHSFAGLHEFHGEVRVDAPASTLGKILARFLGAPVSPSQGPVRFVLAAGPSVETWTRFFPGETMQSTMESSGSRVSERLGPALLDFKLEALDGALEMKLESLRFMGVPCPAWLAPKVKARETGGVGSLYFEVQAWVPLIGMVVSYKGFLNISQEASE